MLYANVDKSARRFTRIIAGLVFGSLLLGAPIALGDTVIAGNPQCIMDVREIDLLPYGPAWKIEVARRFPNSVALLAHGGGPVKNEWLVADNPDGVGPTADTVQTLIRNEQAEYPGRTVVLLCCNPAHYVLHGFPNVFYSTNECWCVPDRAVSLDDYIDSLKLIDFVPNFVLPTIHHDNRSVADPDVTGNVFELIEAK